MQLVWLFFFFFFFFALNLGVISGGADDALTTSIDKSACGDGGGAEGH